MLYSMHLIQLVLNSILFLLWPNTLLGQCCQNMMESMGARQCGNDRPGFGVPSVSPETAGYNIKTF